ncbi:NTF2 fold immunity protein of polymorphic toxin system component [Roseiarcus fermentans]|uniref:NTF2 fold immunity protein of polymorphic toxin system component n=1 Tax=Roseiarcus fermentans TaxID=1473586 RepID=A0A366FUI0_9HYPH|nr:NTF2 fold immunity protein [Roseiarcus fermentans]RBP18334.1 NTF2 fold immunity protein of polymorphic toxin system component [Roseiarcus fermentans]
MSDEHAGKQDSSMWLLTALKETLISEKTAIAMARMVTLDRYGQTKVQRNEPLVARAEGDTWVVTGTYANEFNAKNPPDPNTDGPLSMVISSLDGQILSYTFLPDLPWIREFREKNLK